MFRCCQSEQTVEQTLNWPVIRYAITVIRRRRNALNGKYMYHWLYGAWYNPVKLILSIVMDFVLIIISIAILKNTFLTRRAGNSERKERRKKERRGYSFSLEITLLETEKQVLINIPSIDMFLDTQQGVSSMHEIDIKCVNSNY